MYMSPHEKYPFSLHYLGTLSPEDRENYVTSLRLLWEEYKSSQAAAITNDNIQQIHSQFLELLVSNREYLNYPCSTEDDPSSTFETHRYYNTRSQLQKLHENDQFSRVVNPLQKKAKLEVHQTVEDPEKRLSRLRGTPSKAFMEQLRKSQTTKLVAISATPLASTTAYDPPQVPIDWLYSVKDTNDEIFRVSIRRIPSCNCPTAPKGLNCIHILFLMQKILQVEEDSGLLYQRALLVSELQEIFTNFLHNINRLIKLNCSLCFDPLQDPTGKEEVLTQFCKCGSRSHRSCYMLAVPSNHECIICCHLQNSSQ